MAKVAFKIRASLSEKSFPLPVGPMSSMFDFQALHRFSYVEVNSFNSGYKLQRTRRA